jgi:beta-phosphoglucomutase-like phosphatase (HAD superfamily)
MFCAAIVDMDGLLIDSVRSIMRAWRACSVAQRR